MATFIVSRLLQSIALLLTASLIAFIGVYLIGDPASLFVGDMATDEQRQIAIELMGLDRPLWAQYLQFLGNLLHFDFGRSFVSSTSAGALLMQRLPATIELTFVAFMLALTGIPLGVIAGRYPDSMLGKTIMTGSILGFSLPSFWVGLMLIMLFAVVLGWLPSTGRGTTISLLGVDWAVFTLDGWRHLLMPALNLALFNFALLIRLARSSMREVLLTDYVKYGRAKGLSERRIVWVHAFRNILIPIITIQGVELAHLLTGAIVTENIFAYPGIGRLAIQSLMLLDRPVIVAYMMFVVAVFVLINFIVDLLYAIADPRVGSYERKDG